MADSKISALSDGTTPAGTDQFVIARSGSNYALTWAELIAAAPGAEIGYDQITTSSITVASTTESSGTSIIAGSSHTFDGSPVIATFFCPLVTTPNALGQTIFCLFESSTEITRVASLYTSTSYVHGASVTGIYKFTPSAGAHTYKITAFMSAGSGALVQSGTGGTAGLSPTFLRFTKV